MIDDYNMACECQAGEWAAIMLEYRRALWRNEYQLQTKSTAMPSKRNSQYVRHGVYG